MSAKAIHPLLGQIVKIVDVPKSLTLVSLDGDVLVGFRLNIFSGNVTVTTKSRSGKSWQRITLPRREADVRWRELKAQGYVQW